MTEFIKNLLENKHTTALEWCEPWQGVSEDLQTKTAHVRLRASVSDCILISRHYVKGIEKPQLDDEEHLLDFIAVHWAEPTSIEVSRKKLVLPNAATVAAFDAGDYDHKSVADLWDEAAIAAAEAGAEGSTEDWEENWVIARINKLR